MSHSVKLPWLVDHLLHPYTVLNGIWLRRCISLLLLSLFLKRAPLLYRCCWFWSFDVERELSGQPNSPWVYRCTTLALLIATWLWNFFKLWYLHLLRLLKLQCLVSARVVFSNFNIILWLFDVANLLAPAFPQFYLKLRCWFIYSIIINWCSLNFSSFLKLLEPVVNKI